MTPDPIPALTTPKNDIDWPPPERPEMKPVTWTHEPGRHCLSDQEAKVLQVNVTRLWTHIENCERQIEAMEKAIRYKQVE